MEENKACFPLGHKAKHMVYVEGEDGEISFRMERLEDWELIEGDPDPTLPPEPPEHEEVFVIHSQTVLQNETYTPVEGESRLVVFAAGGRGADASFAPWVEGVWFGDVPMIPAIVRTGDSIRRVAGIWYIREEHIPQSGVISVTWVDGVSPDAILAGTCYTIEGAHQEHPVRSVSAADGDNSTGQLLEADDVLDVKVGDLTITAISWRNEWNLEPSSHYTVDAHVFGSSHTRATAHREEPFTNTYLPSWARNSGSASSNVAAVWATFRPVSDEGPTDPIPPDPTHPPDPDPTEPPDHSEGIPTGTFTHGSSINVQGFQDRVEMPATLWMTSVPWGTWSDLKAPNWKYDALQSSMNSHPNVRVVMMHPLVSQADGFGSNVLTKGANGDFNHHYFEFGEKLKNRGLDNLILRIGWEASGGWYPWGFNNGENNAQRFAATWRHFVNSVRAAFPDNRFVFQWDMHQDVTNASLHNAWPGDEYVDVISMSNYDEVWRPSSQPPETDVLVRWAHTVQKLDRVRNFAASKGKPLAFTEWGVWSGGSDSRGGGDNPYYIEQMWKYMLHPDNNVHYTIYFDVNATGNHKLEDHPNSLAAFKEFGKATSSPLKGALSNL